MIHFPDYFELKYVCFQEHFEQIPKFMVSAFFTPFILLFFRFNIFVNLCNKLINQHERMHLQKKYFLAKWKIVWNLLEDLHFKQLYSEIFHLEVWTFLQFDVIHIHRVECVLIIKNQFVPGFCPYCHLEWTMPDSWHQCCCNKYEEGSSWDAPWLSQWLARAYLWQRPWVQNEKETNQPGLGLHIICSSKTWNYQGHKSVQGMQKFCEWCGRKNFKVTFDEHHPCTGHCKTWN